MSATGQIGHFFWAQRWKEEPELFVPDVVRVLGDFVLGKTALNVSWDSGLLQPSPELVVNGWSSHAGKAVSPVVDASLASAWPRSACGFDEWYFFNGPPPPTSIQPICNHLGFQLANWQDYNQPWGVNLLAQLEETSPELVVGESYSVYVLSPHRKVIEQFLAAAVEP
jgi:hypothetical protein